MVYTLMHKNNPVAAVEINSDTNSITKVLEVFKPEHLPLAVQYRAGLVDVRSLNRWWMGRAIPASRSGIRDALEALEVPTTETLLVKCFGLSLSDQYWVNPSEKPLQWAAVNFFHNDFSDDVGKALFGQDVDAASVDLMSPDNTSDGWLKKKWIISEGKRMLLKGGSSPYHQEPLNELLASAVMKRLGIPHVEYSLTWDGDEPLSACEDFITADTDLVSAWQISVTQKRPNHLSQYEHFLNCCSKLGIPNVQQWLDQMLVLDYLIANTDRHFNNFGAIRNASTLEWISPAPLFDSGTSMWHNQLSGRIKPDAPTESKPFRKTHAEQIQLVTSFDWIDFAALHGLEEEYSEILKASTYIDDERRDTLCAALATRHTQLQAIAHEHTQQEGIHIDMEQL